MTYKGRTLVGAVLKHKNRRLTYLVFVYAPTAHFLKYRKAFETFGRSFRAF